MEQQEPAAELAQSAAGCIDTVVGLDIATHTMVDVGARCTDLALQLAAVVHCRIEGMFAARDTALVRTAQDIHHSGLAAAHIDRTDLESLAVAGYSAGTASSAGKTYWWSKKCSLEPVLLLT